MIKLFPSLGKTLSYATVGVGAVTSVTHGDNLAAHCDSTVNVSHAPLTISNEDSDYVNIASGKTTGKLDWSDSNVMASRENALVHDDYKYERGIQSAIEYVSRRSRLKDQLLPADISILERERAWEQILTGVRDVLSKPEVMDEMIEVVRKMKPAKLHDELKSLSSDAGSTMSDIDVDVDIDVLKDIDLDSQSENKSAQSTLPYNSMIYSTYANGQQWDELVTDHSCMICRDLLAAPVITNCSHSFCGICLTDHMDSIESTDIEVLHPCPVCNKHISYETYETVLDESIVTKVKLISPCKFKDNWGKRRQEYLMLRKKNNKAVNHNLDVAIQCAIPVLAFLVVVCFICL